MEDNTPASKKDLADLAQKLAEVIDQHRYVQQHFKAMCKLNDVYSMMLELSREQVREGFAVCLQDVRKEELNALLNKGDSDAC